MKKNKITVIGLSGESNFYKVDHFNEIGETVIASEVHTEYGGKGYNQALAIARCETNVDFITCLGNDTIKDKVIDSLQSESVFVYPIIKEGKSAKASIIINSNGDNNVICYTGVANELTKEDVMSIKDSIVDSNYLLLQLESSDESLEEAINIAYSNDTKIILNPAPYHNISDELLSKCYILTPNENEALQLFNIDFIKEPNRLKEVKYNNVIVTLGSKGCLVKVGNNINHILPRKTKQINSTGAGDTFNGILVAFLLKGYSILDSAYYASIGASLSVEKEYVVDSIPTIKDILNVSKMNK